MAKFLLILIKILGFLARFYKIDSPIADWHSWRQADTAAVSRNLVKEFNLFYPKGVDMSGVAEHPIPNLGAYRFVEFPVYNLAVYPFYLLFGVDDKYSRLASVLFSLGSIIFLYLITKKYAGIATGLLTAFIFAVLPFNVFFSRSTLPEPTFIFFSLGMIYFVDQRKLALGLIFSVIAFLIKPWTIFFALPLIYSNWPPSKKKILLGLLAITPFAIWRLWIMQYPEGIPASNWLLNGDEIRFRPAFWWWIISERLGGEILGVTGLTLFIIGLIIKSKTYFFHIWAISFFAYFAIFATGNVRHNYYQTSFLPIAAIFLSLGVINLVRGLEGFIPRIWTIALAILLLPLTVYFTWVPVKEFYKINNSTIAEVGKAADQILPEEAVVLAPYNGDTALLYHINRHGWPVTAFPIPELVSFYGVTHYVSTSYDSKTNWVKRHFLVVKENKDYLIADLTKIIKPLSKEDPEP